MADIHASARFMGPVTPSDTAVRPFKALYVGGQGDVTILPRYAEGSTPTQEVAPTPVTFSAVPTGQYLCTIGDKIMQTGTTATNIVWLNW